MKHHLVGTSKDVGACIAVPEDVKKVMLNMVSVLQQNFIKKSIAKESLWESSMDDLENLKKRFCQEESEGSSNIFKKRGTQTTLIPFPRKVKGKMHAKKLLYSSTIMLFHLM